MSEWREVRFQRLIDERVLEIGDGYRAKKTKSLAATALSSCVPGKCLMWPSSSTAASV